MDVRADVTEVRADIYGRKRLDKDEPAAFTDGRADPQAGIEGWTN